MTIVSASMYALRNTTALPPSVCKISSDERFLFYGTETVPFSAKCAHCRERKPINFFGKSLGRSHGIGSYCLHCVSLRRKIKYAKDPEKSLSDMRSRHLLKNYGITLDKYDEILKKQGGGCAICHETIMQDSVGKKRHFPVDHCHVSGKIRGILCSGCNTGIGGLKDNVDLLKAAIEYLTIHGD